MDAVISDADCVAVGPYAEAGDPTDGFTGITAVGGGAVWAANTVGKGGNRLVMQSDGNLVLYGPGGVVWAKGSGQPGARKRFQFSKR